MAGLGDVSQVDPNLPTVYFLGCLPLCKGCLVRARAVMGVNNSRSFTTQEQRFRILDTSQGSYPPLPRKVYPRSCLGASESNSHTYTLIAQGVHDCSDTKKCHFSHQA